MCDADAEGNVYSYTIVASDLLKGGGPELIGLQLASDGTYDGQPQDVAAKVCVAYLKAGGEVVHIAEDGLNISPGFIVFVKDGSGHTYLCNATGDAGRVGLRDDRRAAHLRQQARSELGPLNRDAEGSSGRGDTSAPVSAAQERNSVAKSRVSPSSIWR